MKKAIYAMVEGDCDEVTRTERIQNVILFCTFTVLSYSVRIRILHNKSTPRESCIHHIRVQFSSPVLHWSFSLNASTPKAQITDARV